MPYLPTPAPWTLRLIKGTALTHAELDDNQKILNQKINDTTGSNIGGGIGFFVNKTTNANDGTLNFRTFTGAGGTNIFLSGDTIVISGSNANTDVYTTGITYSNAILTLRRNDNVNLPVTITGFSTNDTFVTGGTYSNSNGIATFTNNTGGTFNVTGFTTGTTDTYVTGFTYTSPQTISLTQNRTDQYSSFTITLSGLSNTDVFVTGGTFSNGTAIFTNNTGGTFNVTGFTTGTTGFDVFVTGGTYNGTGGTATFTNNTGGTFSVTGFCCSDIYVTGITLNKFFDLELTRNDGVVLTGSFSALTAYMSGFSTGDTYVTGATYSGTTAINQNAYLKRNDNINVQTDIITPFISGDSGTRSIQALGHQSYVDGDFSFGLGKNNTLSASDFTNIVNGSGNTINTSSWSSIIGGSGNIISGGTGSKITSRNSNVIIGGDSNVIMTSCTSSIISSCRSSICDSIFSNIAFAKHQALTNTIISASTSSNIIGGIKNFINCSTYSNIIGGYGSHMFCNINSSTLGAVNSCIQNTISTVIIGGQSNRIQQSSFGTIIGGYANRSTGSTYTSIIGASYNCASYSNNSLLGGGYCNVIDLSCRSAIIGGRNLSLSSCNDMVFVPQLRISTATTNNSLINLLVLDTDGTVRTRVVSSITGGSGGDIYVTGATYSGTTPHDQNAFLQRTDGINVQTDIITPFISGDSGTRSIKALGHNDFVSGHYSFGVGKDHIISGAAFSSIIGGVGNTIISGSTFTGFVVSLSGFSSSIIGGMFNSLSGGCSSSIIGGYGNTINLESFSTIIGGVYNTICCAFGNNTILGGVCNIISNTGTSYSLIGGGYNNRITNSYRSSIIGGQNLILSGCSDMVYVPQLRISTATTNNSLINLLVLDTDGTVRTRVVSSITGGSGGDIYVTGATYSGTTAINQNAYLERNDGINVQTDIITPFISGDSGTRSIKALGHGNTVNSAFAFALGTANTINTSNYSSVVNGIGNIITGSSGSSIVGGGVHTINNSAWSSIIGGASNTISGNSASQLNKLYNIIDGGRSNTICSGQTTGIVSAYRGHVKKSSYSGILFVGIPTPMDIYNPPAIRPAGGASAPLALISASTNSVIINGYRQTISYSTFSSILNGGSNCVICSNVVSILGSGISNITGSTYSSIIGGKQQVIHNSYYNSIIGGNANFISASTSSVVIGGFYNLINNNSIESVINGGYYNNINNNSYRSSIIGGYHNSIDSSNRSSIIGGQNLTLSACSDMVYVPQLRINSATTNNALTNLLILDTDGTVRVRDVSTISGGSGGTDTYVTGGTYSNGTAIFTNNTGGTFNVTGFTTGDTYVTGFTYDNANTLTIKQNQGQTDLTVLVNTMTGLTVNGTLSATTYLNLPIDIRVTGGTYNNGTAIFTNNTGGTFNVTGFISANTYTTGATYSGTTAINQNAYLQRTDGINVQTDIITPFISGDSGTRSIKALGHGNIVNGDFSFVIGSGNTLYSNYGLNSGGKNNIIYSGSNYSSIINGYNNIVSEGSNNSTILGGYINTLSGTSQSSIIGSICSTLKQGSSSIIVGGNATYLLKATESAIIGGRNNQLDTTLNSFIAGGNSNFIKEGSNYSSIIGGITNVICNASNNSSIIGGTNNFISASTRSSIIGGQNLTLSGCNDMVYVPQLRISTATTNNSLTNLLILDTDGTVRVRDVSTISGGSGSTSDTFITGFTYNNANTLTITNSTGGSLSVLVNTMTGLTVNTISATTYLNLPIDIRVTGGTYTAGTATFTNNTGGTFNVTGFSSSSSNSVGCISLIVDGNGGVVSTGNKKYIKVPYSGTITGWTIIGSPSGSCIFDVWNSTGIPTVANTITSSNKPTLTAAQLANSLNVTGWTTTISTNDIIGFNLDSASGCTWVILELFINKT